MKKLPCKKKLLYYKNPMSFRDSFFAYYRERRWHLHSDKHEWTEFPDHPANKEYKMFARIGKGEVIVIPESEVRIPLPKEMYKS